MCVSFLSCSCSSTMTNFGTVVIACVKYQSQSDLTSRSRQLNCVESSVFILHIVNSYPVDFSNHLSVFLTKRMILQ